MNKIFKNIKLKNIYRVFVLIFPIVLIGMLPFIHTEKIIIDTIYPTEIVAGEVFNPYNGQSVISISGSGFTTDDVIYINNKECETSFGNSSWLTGIVEEDLYKVPSELKVKVVRKQGEKVLLKSKVEVINVS